SPRRAATRPGRDPKRRPGRPRRRREAGARWRPPRLEHRDGRGPGAAREGDQAREAAADEQRAERAERDAQARLEGQQGRPGGARRDEGRERGGEDEERAHGGPLPAREHRSGVYASGVPRLKRNRVGGPGAGGTRPGVLPGSWPSSRSAPDGGAAAAASTRP